MPDLTAPDILALIALAFFVAALVKGTTGLGFSTTALAILALFIGVKPALPLMIIPSVSSNLLVMRDAGGFKAALSDFRWLYLAAIPGMALGLWALARSDAAVLSAALGAVLVLYCLFALARPDFRLPANLEGPLAPVTGFLTGIVNGMTGSQVMPVLPYLMSLQLTPDRFVQAINISFTLCSLIMVIGLSRLGLITVETLVISVGGLVPMVIGLKSGTVLRRRLSPDLFRTLVLCLLIVFGLLLIGKIF